MKISFYFLEGCNRKAIVFVEGNKKYLFSYTTLVADIEQNEHAKILRIFGYYSTTTSKHINNFCKEYNFKIPSKKQIELEVEKIGYYEQIIKL